MINVHSYLGSVLLWTASIETIPVKGNDEVLNYYCLFFLPNNNPKEEFLSKIMKLYYPDSLWGSLTSWYNSDKRYKIFC